MDYSTLLGYELDQLMETAASCGVTVSLELPNGSIRMDKGNWHWTYMPAGQFYTAAMFRSCAMTIRSASDSGKLL